MSSNQLNVLDIGEAARFAFVFTDVDHALATPAAVTITLHHPETTRPTADTVTPSPDGSIVLGKVFPPPTRERLAKLLAKQVPGITADPLATGTGCAEYTRVVTDAGLYTAKANDGAGRVETASVQVREDWT